MSPDASQNTPCVPLKTIQAIVAAGRVDVGSTRARDPIMQHYDCSAAEAVQFAKDTISKLRPRDFIKQVTLGGGQRADEYGILQGDTGWYVKVLVARNADASGDRVVVPSCHPAERDMRTKGGVVPAWVDGGDE